MAKKRKKDGKLTLSQRLEESVQREQNLRQQLAHIIDHLMSDDILREKILDYVRSDDEFVDEIKFEIEDEIRASVRDELISELS